MKKKLTLVPIISAIVITCSFNAFAFRSEESNFSPFYQQSEGQERVVIINYFEPSLSPLQQQATEEVKEISETTRLEDEESTKPSRVKWLALGMLSTYTVFWCLNHPSFQNVIKDRNSFADFFGSIAGDLYDGVAKSIKFISSIGNYLNKQIASSIKLLGERAALFVAAYLPKVNISKPLECKPNANFIPLTEQE